MSRTRRVSDIDIGSGGDGNGIRAWHDFGALTALLLKCQMLNSPPVWSAEATAKSAMAPTTARKRMLMVIGVELLV